MITTNVGHRHQPPPEVDVVGSVRIFFLNNIVGSCLYVLPHCICVFRCSVFIYLFRSLPLTQECVQNISRKPRIYYRCTHTYIKFLEHSSRTFCPLNMRAKRCLQTSGSDHVSQRHIPEQGEIFFLELTDSSSF